MKTSNLKACYTKRNHTKHSLTEDLDSTSRLTERLKPEYWPVDRRQARMDMNVIAYKEEAKTLPFEPGNESGQ